MSIEDADVGNTSDLIGARWLSRWRERARRPTPSSGSRAKCRDRGTPQVVPLQCHTVKIEIDVAYFAARIWFFTGNTAISNYVLWTFYRDHCKFYSSNTVDFVVSACYFYFVIFLRWTLHFLQCKSAFIMVWKVETTLNPLIYNGFPVKRLNYSSEPYILHWIQ